MKTILTSFISATFMLGAASAHEVSVSPTVAPHSTISAAEHRAAQLNGVAGPCTAKYITTITPDGAKSTRKSVDCQE